MRTSAKRQAHASLDRPVVCRKSGDCHAKRPANCSGGDFSLQRASTSAPAGAGENEGRFGRSGETCGRTERATRRKGKRTRRSTRRFVCCKAGDCHAKRQAGCGGRHFGLQRASKSASARAGENEGRFGRSGESRGCTERATRRKGRRTRRSTRRFVCRKAGGCHAKRQAGCGGRHFGLQRASKSASARAGENEGRFGRSGETRGCTERATQRKGRRTRRSTRRFVCRKAGDCHAKRQAGCGGRHFGLQRASKFASARAGENEGRFGRSGETLRPHRTRNSAKGQAHASLNQSVRLLQSRSLPRETALSARPCLRDGQSRRERGPLRQVRWCSRQRRKSKPTCARRDEDTSQRAAVTAQAAKDLRAHRKPASLDRAPLS